MGLSEIKLAMNETDIEKIPSLGNDPTNLIDDLDIDSQDFNRIEDKFFVKREHKEELLKLIHAHLDKDEYYRDVKFTTIESNYFDTRNLNIVRDHFTAQERFKIRVRRYAPNGEWLKDVILLEVKTKKAGVSRKFRFQMSPADYKVLLTKGFIPYSMDLRHRNSDIDEKNLQKRVEKVNRKLLKKGMVPMCSVTYNRDAYERDGLRVTIDENLKATIHQDLKSEMLEEFKRAPEWQKLMAMRDRMNVGDYLLVEVKHGGVIPEWIADFLARTQSNEVSFSKYCYSIGEHILRK